MSRSPKNLSKKQDRYDRFILFYKSRISHLRFLQIHKTICFYQSLKNDQVLALLTLFIWLILFLAYIIPIHTSFDGTLLTTNLSFTYSGKEEKLFLDSVESIQQINIKGMLPSITLEGKFTSTDPVLRAKLSSQKQIKITFPSSKSRIIFEPKDPSQASELSLNELQLRPNTTVNNLAYQSQLHSLKFCINALFKEVCEQPSKSEFNRNEIANLELQLGTQPLSLSLKDASISSIGNATEQIIMYTPIADTLNISLQSPTQLIINLSKTSKPEPEKSESKETKAKSSEPDIEALSEYLWGDLEVKNVQFSRTKINPADTSDHKTFSTIQEGKIRIQSQALELQPQQFLIFPNSETSITKLRDLRIEPKASNGIRTYFTGSTDRIAIGHYPKLPIQEIKVNRLSQFPTEFISAFLALLGAFTGVLLPRLFPTETQSKP